MIVVAIFAALSLAGFVAYWAHRLRTERRYLGDTSILDEPEVDARLVERHDELVDEMAAKAQAAQRDSTISTPRD